MNLCMSVRASIYTRSHVLKVEQKPITTYSRKTEAANKAEHGLLHARLGRALRRLVKRIDQILSDLCGPAGIALNYSWIFQMQSYKHYFFGLF